MAFARRLDNLSRATAIVIGGVTRSAGRLAAKMAADSESRLMTEHENGPPVLVGRDLRKTFRREMGDVVNAAHDGVGLQAFRGTLTALVGPDVCRKNDPPPLDHRADDG